MTIKRVSSVCFAAWFAALGVVCCRADASQLVYRMGIDFIDQTTNLPALPYKNSEGQTVDGYEPSPLTGPNSAGVQDGGLAGWTEAEIRREVTKAVESIYRIVDTGDPDTTLNVAFYFGLVPTCLQGRRMNAAVAHAPHRPSNILGEAFYDSYDLEGVPDNLHLSFTSPANIYGLSGVSFDTAEKVINAVSGTIAHEIGHVFGLPHGPRGDTQPYPIMATGNASDPGVNNDPLLNADRLTRRAFIDTHVTDLTARLGTVNRADFDFDGDVDLAESPFGGSDGQSDLDILIANRGTQTAALMTDGDADNDGDVDFAENPFGGGDGTSDLDLLIANQSMQFDTLAAQVMGEAEMIYDAATGTVSFDDGGGGIVQMRLFVDTSAITIDTALADGFFTESPSTLNEGAIQFFNASGLAKGEDLVGLPGFLPTGLTADDLANSAVFEFQFSGRVVQQGSITVIPEPGVAAMGLALLGWFGMRRRAA